MRPNNRTDNSRQNFATSDKPLVFRDPAQAPWWPIGAGVIAGADEGHALDGEVRLLDDDLEVFHGARVVNGCGG